MPSVRYPRLKIPDLELNMSSPTRGHLDLSTCDITNFEHTLKQPKILTEIN